MIRIDEIYNNTFWPWMKKNCSGTRMFFCDPPGRSDPDALFNLGPSSPADKDYVFFHDQEPVWTDLHQPLFQEVKRRNYDLEYHQNIHGHVVVSEQGEYVEQLQVQYGWTPHYYFYHAWACLDWFRGYDRT